MDTYPVLNVRGEVIGQMTLYEPSLTSALMDGLGFSLGAGWYPAERRFSHILIIPNPAIDLATRCANRTKVKGDGSPAMWADVTCTRPIGHDDKHSNGVSLWE